MFFGQAKSMPYLGRFTIGEDAANLFSRHCHLPRLGAKCPQKSAIPPDVDKSAARRVNEFCELHKQGKFRQAEQMVADDTKDYFYNSGKLAM